MESVLGLNGYRVARTQAGRRALELARKISPDAIMIDESLPDIAGLEVCRALRDDPLFDHSTAVFLFASGHAAGRARSDAHLAGAWEYCTQPLHLETLVQKLAIFIRARRELGLMQSKTLFDHATGLYSAYGLQQMARQLTARATRNHEPLACMALMPDENTSGEFDTTGRTISAPMERVINLCRDASRRSDVVGYLGDSRVAILAPVTNSAGVATFATRIRSRIADTNFPGPRPAVRIGFCAFDDFAATAIEPSEVLRRAEIALQHASAYAPDVSFDTIASN